MKVNDTLKNHPDNNIETILRVLLLKIAVEMNWKMNPMKEKKFMEILMELAKTNSSQIIKKSGEDNVVELWEKMVDKSHMQNDMFNVLYQHLSSADANKGSISGITVDLKKSFEYVQTASSYLDPLLHHTADFQTSCGSNITTQNCAPEAS